MSLFAIDEKKCKKDGICAAECPLNLIVLETKASFPTPVAGAESACILCGHCVAVCPHGALSHVGMTPEQCLPISDEYQPSPEQTEHLLRSRRSIRVYKNKPVPKEILAKLIEIARYAPSGHNSQAVEWIVVSGTDQVRTLTGHVADWMCQMIENQPEIAKSLKMDRVLEAWNMGKDTITRETPHLIMTHAPQDNRYAPAACTIALTYLDIAAPAFGLGTCWAGHFNAAATLWTPLKTALGIPENHTPFGAMMAGYPQYRYHRIPTRKEARIAWR